MDSIHEIELAFAFLCLIHDGLQCGNPFSLFLQTRSAWYGLRFYEPEATETHYLSCPCQAERDTADVEDNACCLGRTSRYFGFQTSGYLIHVVFQSVWASRNRSNSENGINYFIVINMNQAVNEIAAASCDCGYPLAAQLWFGDFGYKGTVTFSNYAGGIYFVFLFETGIRLLVIFDGEQCCIDVVRIRLLSINDVRRHLLGMRQFPFCTNTLCFTYNLEWSNIGRRRSVLLILF